jgi:hypothetical protein
MRQAWDILDQYREKLAAQGFKSTTTIHDALYRDFESPLFSKLRREWEEDDGSYNRVLQTIPRLRALLVQGVDIQQEDHGKAILVFTIVTIISLPMSFVTGFLGMNAADIRSLEKGQWVFWASTMPLTCVVVAVSVWIGYSGKSLSILLWQTKSKLLLARSSHRKDSGGKCELSGENKIGGSSQEEDETGESSKLSRSARKLAHAVRILGSRRDTRQVAEKNSHPERDGQV